MATRIKDRRKQFIPATFADLSTYSWFEITDPKATGAYRGIGFKVNDAEWDNTIMFDRQTGAAQSVGVYRPVPVRHLPDICICLGGCVEENQGRGEPR